MTEKLSRKKLGHELGESDAPADTEHEAATRATGGVAGSDDGDRLSTTGTGPNETFVGRASGGDDLGYAGETGAEARAEAEKRDEPS
ncbi:hypothetical protein GCM10009789_30630 [Kribbella sancticallisti]|uniref:Uncharacterized protein n=1 Tax=Kribbella sancticallisti TaxID=460087 RepID=A0ABN2DCR6_9ACTN